MCTIIQFARFGLHFLVIPRTSSTLGDRAFSVVAPTLWNSLPVNIRCCSSLQSFKNLLKTYLYNQVYTWSCSTWSFSSIVHCFVCFLVFMSAPWNSVTTLWRIINAYYYLLAITRCLAVLDRNKLYEHNELALKFETWTKYNIDMIDDCNPILIIV